MEIKNYLFDPLYNLAYTSPAKNIALNFLIIFSIISQLNTNVL